jgi:hypothetical protein
MDLNKDGVFLIRYSDGGEFGGDTWAPNREVALEVAADEFGLNESDWIEAPENVADAISFARTAVGPRMYPLLRVCARLQGTKDATKHTKATPCATGPGEDTKRPQKTTKNNKKQQKTTKNNVSTERRSWHARLWLVVEHKGLSDSSHWHDDNSGGQTCAEVNAKRGWRFTLSQRE